MQPFFVAAIHYNVNKSFTITFGNQFEIGFICSIKPWLLIDYSFSFQFVDLFVCTRECNTAHRHMQFGHRVHRPPRGAHLLPEKIAKESLPSHTFHRLLRQLLVVRQPIYRYDMRLGAAVANAIRRTPSSVCCGNAFGFYRDACQHWHADAIFQRITNARPVVRA